jgi:hypothetical protein
MGIYLKSVISESTLLAYSFTLSYSSLQPRIAVPVQLPYYGACFYAGRNILYISWILLMAYDLGVSLTSCRSHDIPDSHNRDKQGPAPL